MRTVISVPAYFILYMRENSRWPHIRPAATLFVYVLIFKVKFAFVLISGVFISHPALSSHAGVLTH